ncbi:hypothetical protein [Natronosalvus rutilus]|uniref:Uncharacterized protein n=1 Tax=Natronosalvus rutilus TaxID=2953753 RepID=A0A9E7NED7_9EURY|nr:hypothetical protein [Natronosalvus rutilus]UTF55951.1 hypothetical protein NGM29_20890 [Natronosalvus rutilus]
MTADNLTDDDRSFLDSLDTLEEIEGQGQDEPCDELTPDELKEEVQDLRDEVRGWQQVTRDLASDVSEQQETIRGLTATLNDVQARLDGDDPTDPRSGNYYEDMTILEKYASMSEDERQDLLAGNTSKLRAVTIFEHWGDWSQHVQAGQVISTNHTRGRYNKIALKVDLQAATGETLHNAEVYRAMKALAKLSVTETEEVEEVTDSAGREHITGGAFEYHEKPTPDSSSTFKMVKLADPDRVTLL